MYWRVHHWKLARASTGAIKAPVPLATNRHSYVISRTSWSFWGGGGGVWRQECCMCAYFISLLSCAVSESDMSGYSDIGETETGWIRPIACEDIPPFYLDKIPQCIRAPTWGHGPVVGLAVLCSQLDSMVLRVFCNLNDSMAGMFVIWQLLLSLGVFQCCMEWFRRQIRIQDYCLKSIVCSWKRKNKNDKILVWEGASVGKSSIPAGAQGNMEKNPNVVESIA